MSSWVQEIVTSLIDKRMNVLLASVAYSVTVFIATVEIVVHMYVAGTPLLQ